MSLMISSTSRSTTHEIEERFLYRLLWRGRSLPRDLSSCGKRNIVDQLGVSEYQRMWSIKDAKKRRCEDGGEEAISQATTNGDHPTKRPVGVKAAKGAGGKRNIVDQLGVSEYQRMWSIKE
ncbi:hypothetical protein F2Q70_00037487 [Brassica cretica]|uniref:Uncharacterized protein n=1 Tax=Brassica cretica TaxID=69181 RepID=A0A8S9JV69_BRACR|nr:hypothetical protein F2Q70_00037487 [Brassica cretica]